MSPVSHQSGSIGFSRSNIPGGFLFGFYDATLPLGKAIIYLLSLSNKKLKTSLQGRKGGVNKWNIGAQDARPGILIHASSYGEYEGIRPLVDRLIEDGKARIAVSFSSPSARKVVETTEGLWAHGYLPFDSLNDQLRFLARIEPDVILVTKHDLWPNMVRAAKALRIPVILANANFPAGSSRLKPMSRIFHRSFMKYLESIWAVSDADAERARKLIAGQVKVEAVGDTRYDRVRQRAIRGEARFTGLKSALGSDRIFIIGSCWQEDEKICWKAFTRLKTRFPEIKMIMVPHEPTEEAIRRNKDRAAEAGFELKLLSAWKGEEVPEAVMLVDKIGVLADLYAVGWAAHVGGGFGRGVHSVIEPAAHGIPVSFGPNHGVSHEASLLLEAGGGFVADSSDNIEELWGNWLSDTGQYNSAVEAAVNVVKSREGITDVLLGKLKAYIDL